MACAGSLRGAGGSSSAANTCPLHWGRSHSDTLTARPLQAHDTEAPWETGVSCNDVALHCHPENDIIPPLPPRCGSQSSGLPGHKAWRGR